MAAARSGDLGQSRHAPHGDALRQGALSPDRSSRERCRRSTDLCSGGGSVTYSKHLMSAQLWCGLVLAAAAMLSPLAASADPVRLRVAWVAVPGQLTPILYENKSILKHYGTSYTVEPVRVPGSGPQLTALASGELEIAQFAPAAFALAVQNAHME